MACHLVRCLSTGFVAIPGKSDLYFSSPPRSGKPKAYPMNILDLYLRISVQVFSKAGDKNIQTSAEEVIIPAPNLLENLRTFENFAPVVEEKTKQVGFFLGESFLFTLQNQA